MLVLALIVSLLVYYTGFYLFAVWYAHRRMAPGGPPSGDFIAQMGHAGWGALIVSQCVIWLPRFAWMESWIAALIGLGAAILLWAAPKEFLWDKYVEGQDFASNLTDFLFYLLGAGIITSLAVSIL
jgi:hypothetical protein